MEKIKEIKDVSEEKADEMVDNLVFCSYCGEPFKECDAVILGIGVIIGKTDVKFYKGRYWHYGCIYDFEKEKRWRLQ